MVNPLAVFVLAAAPLQQPIAITNVTVIDGRDSLPRRNMTIVIENRRIRAVGRSVNIPANAQRIDGRGKYLIPGLWDLHVHLAVPGGAEVLPLYLANGVTGVRDLGGDWSQLATLRSRVRAGSIPGPRILTSGPYLEGNPQPIPHLRVSSPEASAPLDPLIATLVRNRTAVVPTFTAQYEVALWPGRKLPGDRYARHLPDTLKQYVAAIFPMPDSIPPGADQTGKAVFAKRLAQVGALHRAGVVVLPGTDAPLRNSPPGFGLHLELEWLAKAGLSPWAVLKAATLDAAEFLGLADSLGTIAPGKLADLVLLDADPLRDIRHTRRIRAVIADGRPAAVHGGASVPSFP